MCRFARIERNADGTWSVGGLRARHLVGAGGTHCPVARLLEPRRPNGPVAAQEHEFRADPEAVARARIGADGEPELLLHEDFRGYSWNVPKTDWINVGSGTVSPTEVRAAWTRFREDLLARGHVPAEAAPELAPAAMKGWAYYLFDPAHLDGAARVDADRRGGAYLVGDSLGLAQPLTAEGILPAIVSGRLAAEAILAGDPASYPTRLRAHPVLADYRRVYRLREAAARLLSPGGDKEGAPTPAAGNGAPNGTGAAPDGAGGPLDRLSRWAVARGFAWMFSGARMPAPGVIDLALTGAERWLVRRTEERPTA